MRIGGEDRKSLNDSSRQSKDSSETPRYSVVRLVPFLPKSLKSHETRSQSCERALLSMNIDKVGTYAKIAIEAML